MLSRLFPGVSRRLQGTFDFSGRRVSTLNRAFVIVAAGLCLPGLSYVLQRDFGLSLWDEGFLWYGVQRVLAGEVPLRDFQAYDIARYYWAASVMGLTGSKGVTALRLANTLLLALALVLALHLVNRRSRAVTLFASLVTGGIFLLWMVPDFKAADFLASIVLIFGLAQLVEKPGRQSAFVCGLVIGLAAVLGRNHGVYGLVAGAGAVAYLAYRHQLAHPLRVVCVLLAGCAAGYTPMVIFTILTPGFASAFWDGVRFLFEYRATNIALPVPWPWALPFAPASALSAVRQVAAGIFFLGLPCFAIISLGYLLAARRVTTEKLDPVFVSSALLVLPYAHYAYSRADVFHLALGIFPFLIGLMTSPLARSPRASGALVLLLLAASLAVMLHEQPAFGVLRNGEAKVVTVAGDTLKVTPDTAWEISLLSQLAEHYAPQGRPFLAAPFWPGAYAVLERKAPTWEIYGLFPRSSSFQQAEIGRIRAADIGFAIVTDFLLDGREDLLYENTHPAMDRYIRENYEEIDVTSLPEIRVYVPAADREPGGSG